MNDFVPFDQVWPRIHDVLSASRLGEVGLPELWVIRDLRSRIRLAVPDDLALSSALESLLADTARQLSDRLGAHAYPPDRMVLRAEGAELDALRADAVTTQMGSLSVYLVDRLLTGMGWGKVPEGLSATTRRYTLFSLKGGVGRSTTAAVLATHLAGRGLRVLVVDLDLESPGLSSMLLAPGEHPDYGVVDWFVEDLVGQSDPVLAHMVGRPRWCQDLQGDILVAPAYGSDPGEYISKLGRVYLDLPADGPDAVVEPWSARLVRMLVELENRHKPDVILLDSRSGLHDLAAATVTDLQAQVFLFAVDSEATWAGYRLLFDYWRAHGAATVIRQRLSLVASLVPQERASVLLKRMRERAWDLFREYLYDTVPADPEEEARTEPFSFDLMDDEAPHSPWPIYWNTGLSWVPSIRGLEEPAVFAAYQGFLERFDELSMAAQEGQP